jgi:hypothetical protein
MNKLKITDGAEKFRLDLEYGTRFTTTTGKLNGAPVPGIGDMDRGLLPEMYWSAAAEAVYAVYHYETPILWKTQDGTWYVPMHLYSATTSKLRNKMVEALKLSGTKIEEI